MSKATKQEINTMVRQVNGTLNSRGCHFTVELRAAYGRVGLDRVKMAPDGKDYTVSNISHLMTYTDFHRWLSGFMAGMLLSSDE